MSTKSYEDKIKDFERAYLTKRQETQPSILNGIKHFLNICKDLKGPLKALGAIAILQSKMSFNSSLRVDKNTAIENGLEYFCVNTDPDFVPKPSIHFTYALDKYLDNLQRDGCYDPNDEDARTRNRIKAYQLLLNTSGSELDISQAVFLDAKMSLYMQERYNMSVINKSLLDINNVGEITSSTSSQFIEYLAAFATTINSIKSPTRENKLHIFFEALKSVSFEEIESLSLMQYTIEGLAVNSVLHDAVMNKPGMLLSVVAKLDGINTQLMLDKNTLPNNVEYNG